MFFFRDARDASSGIPSVRAKKPGSLCNPLYAAESDPRSSAASAIKGVGVVQRGLGASPATILRRNRPAKESPAAEVALLMLESNLLLELPRDVPELF